MSRYMDAESVPFILMLYEQGGERKKVMYDFPNDFITAFENMPQDEIKIGFFFIMGQDIVSVKSLEDAIKCCKG